MTTAGVEIRRLPSMGLSVESILPVLAARREPFLLDSSASGGDAGRFSICGFDPVDVVEIGWPATPDWIDRLRRRIAPTQVTRPPSHLPFVGGWVGYIAYESGPVLERLTCSKPHDIALPAARFALYDTVAVFDHQERAWYVAVADIPGRDDQRPAQQRIDQMVETLACATAPAPLDWLSPLADEPQPVMSPDEYFARVAAAQRYIHAGDVYQINLTQRFTTRTTATPIELYRRLRTVNPAPYAALLVCGETAILSASPELFLDLRDRWIVTRPIKGTRPRTGDAVLDAAYADALVHSEKDRAELTMIVDLLRNDLGRVSEPGSIRVVSLGDLESHPTVFHRVATITGTLRSNLDWTDLLRATFPGGSITGCPKIRAMRIIDDLETTERGVYCGSIGYIGLDGSMCLNIAIRTMVLDRSRLHLFSGGAIVSDSDPAQEYEETLAKIAGMTRALGTRDPNRRDGVIAGERSA